MASRYCKASLLCLTFLFAKLGYANQQCVSADFAQDSDWQLLNSETFEPTLNTHDQVSRLRLTPADVNIVAGVAFQSAVSSQQDLSIHFTAYSYGGSWGQSARQGDGMSLVISDASVSPIIGGYGGSLGYAPLQSNSVLKPGFTGGWLAIGLDDYGNFSTATEGRLGGPEERRNSVSVRGSGGGFNGYKYLTGTESLTPTLENNSKGHDYQVTLTAQGLLTVKRDTGAGFNTLINEFDVSQHNLTRPEAFRISFVGATGGATNIHEISQLSIISNSCAQAPVVINQDTSAAIDASHMRFSVTLERALAAGEQASIDYQTLNKTALSDQEFFPQSGTLELTAEETTAYIDIPLLQLNTDDIGKQFYLGLSNYVFNDEVQDQALPTLLATLTDIKNTDTDTDNANKPDNNDPNTGDLSDITDSDTDGLIDTLETQVGSDPNLADSDFDGIPDGIEWGAHPTKAQDSDNDGQPDLLDTDDDGDGKSTISEDSNADADNNPFTQADDLDGDGIASYLDADETLNNDSDGDGISDSIENQLSNDQDKDGIPNHLDLDSDGDGISDDFEFDGEINGNEGTKDNEALNTDQDQLPDFLDTDSDNDGISDQIENGHVFPPLDKDNDGIPAYVDINDGEDQNASNDSDQDGLSDAQECPAWPLCQDSNNNSVLDYLEKNEGTSASDTNNPLNNSLEQTAGNTGMVKTSVNGVGGLAILLLMTPIFIRRKSTTVLKPLLALSIFSLAFTAQADNQDSNTSSHNTYNQESSLLDEMDMYLGGGLGISKLNPKTENSGFNVDNDQSQGWKVMAGWDWNSSISLEGFYTKLGKATLKSNSQSGSNTAYLDYHSIGMHGVYTHFIKGDRYLKNSWGVFGKVGLSKIFNQATGVGFEQNSILQVTTGLGAEYVLQNDWSVRGEFEAFDTDASLVSISVVKRFGFSKKRFNRFLASLSLLSNSAAGGDQDNDGVLDGIDDCPNTTNGYAVNEKGCAFFEGEMAQVMFESDSIKMQSSSHFNLDSIASQLYSQPFLRMRIVAHTDSAGSETYNQKLSENRAKQVRLYLLSRGAKRNQLLVSGAGEILPIADNQTAKGRAKNRRVEFQVF